MPEAKKAPQDHKAKAQPSKDPTETPGWHLLQNFADVPVWDQTPLMALLQDAFDSEKDLTEEEIAELTPEQQAEHKAGAQHKTFDVNIIGKLAKALLPYAIDQDAYTKFLSGAGAMERAANLSMAWVGQMGESESSENS